MGRASTSTWKPSHKARAASLAELLVAIFIFAIVLVVASDLLVKSHNLKRLASAQAAGHRLGAALVELCQHSRSALKITAPGPAASSPQYQWVRLRPALDVASSQRLPLVLGATPSPKPASPWDAYQAGWQETVLVERSSSGQLVWTVNSTQSVLAGECLSFLCSARDRLLTFEATVQVAGKVEQITVLHSVEPGVEW